MILDRFRVIRRIGSGGFGTVYLVHDVTVKDELILKVLNPHISVDPTMIQRFVHELKYARRITHRNIIRIHDLLQLGDTHAISMEFFPGQDLGSILEAEGPQTADRCVRIACQVCEGLTAAHAEGVIHRDIKPANILVGKDDMVKVVDFGLAAVTQSAGSRLTKSGILVGTPQYMAPEQIKGDDIDERADIYSLGIVMYEMLSGKPPFHGENAVNILFQHLEGKTTPLRELNAGVPATLEKAVGRIMARDRNERPADARECLDLLLPMAA
jgi:serine/threonine-protein kinase